ncbi:hypothetical protein IMY05_010G0038800 [Salix suchowensis]|nr:hypothetical protein IMY05_010G0038800 [Salix suchowensis]
MVSLAKRIDNLSCGGGGGSSSSVSPCLQVRQLLGTLYSYPILVIIKTMYAFFKGTPSFFVYMRFHCDCI